MTQGLIERAIQRKVQATSKSPMRPTAENTLENIPEYSINKSAIVESSRQMKHDQTYATNISGLSLPTRLQKMKERVQRDRSQNSFNDENRDGSLYGRKKVANVIDEETQKLRESYNIHRKKSKDRSVSGLRQSLGTLSNGGGMTLNKQNFKEDPYDFEFDEKSPMYKSSQSIAMQLRQQNEKSQLNKFKRGTQKSTMTLANYQVKYQKLEQNYRKFTSNLVNPNQSEEIITDLKMKTGITFMMKFLNKQDNYLLRDAIKMWRVNSGLAIKQFNNQGKTLMLAKAVQKMQLRSINYFKIQCYQKWKQIAFRDQGSNPKDRMVRILSEMITNTADFNRCVENDYFLCQILNEKLLKLFDIASSDLLLFEGDETLKSYHFQSGEQINLSTQSLLSNSVLGEIVFDVRQDDSIIKIIQMVQKNPLFNKDIDLPINKEKIIEYNQSESNVFNKVRNLSVALIKIQNPSRIGILRLFFSCPQGGNSPTFMQIQAINHLASALPLFIQRIIDVRSQINSLAINNIDKNKSIQRLEFYNQVNITLNDFQQQLLQNDGEIQQNYQNLLSFTSHTLESFFRNYLEIENVNLKQILNGQKKEFGQLQSLIKEKNELVRITDHIQENNEVLEDFLDHRKEYYIHQISICPLKQGKSEYEDLTFIFHIQNSYDSNQDNNASMVNLSTSITSNILSISALKMAGQPKKYLDDEMKTKLTYFLRYVTPIIKQALAVATEYTPSIDRLQNSLSSAQMKYNLQLTLQKQVNDNKIIEEQNQFNFFIKMKNILSFAISQILPEPINDDQYFDLYINRALFNGNQINNFSHLVFQSFMDDNSLETFQQNIVMANNLDDKRQQKYNISQFEDLQEVSLSLDVFDVQISKFTTKQGNIFVQIPFINQEKYQTMAVITFCTLNEKQIDMVQSIEQELTSFLLDLTGKRMAFQQIQDKHDYLMNKLHGEKISQETKDMIENNLIIPFLKKQSLKCLGDSIDYLADKLIKYEFEDGQDGQEISQIAFLNQNTYIEDIRLQSTYSQLGLDINNLDKMMLQSFQLKQQIVYEDDILEKVIILYPFMSSMSYKSALMKHNSAIILRIVIDRDNNIERRVQSIHNHFINALSPIMDAIMQHDIVSIKQTYAIHKMASIIEKYKFASYREIIYFMRDLKAKNVYNFSRSGLYSKLAKSKIIFEKKNKMAEDFFDVEDKHLTQNQIIQAHIRKAVTTMNKFAFLYKQSCFKKFVIGTRTPLYANMSKKKKKAVCSLANFYSLCVMRELFLRYAVNSKCYKYISHPKTKYLGSVSCIFRNFRIVRERLAFIKMKKNLNMVLRESMNSYRENDKDLFIQLNQILISSQTQMGGLDGGFAYSISEIFSYLKNITEQDLHIRDIGLLANDTYVGHVDEAILTLKSNVYMTSATTNKLKILMCDLTDKSGDHFSNNRRRPLRLSFDENIGISQEDQLFGHINNQNLDKIDQIDIIPQNEFENQLGMQYSKYVISQRKDVIHQMLEKSNGITFNFQNIQESMSDIFLGQQSHHQDQNIGNRYTVVRRSKSALIIPLFDVSQSQVIGSFEIYKHHQQAFTEEIEERYEHFSKLVGDFLLLYGNLNKSILQINQLKWQITKQVKPVNSLSLLLKNVYVNGPSTHFPNASHVMPVILMNQQIEILEDDVPNIPPGVEIYDNKVILNQKLAFFYQFKDNIIYSFDYECTFIQEMIDNGCILEMCKRGAMDRDEDVEEFVLSKQSSIENIGNDSIGFTQNSGDESHRFAGQRHRTIPAQLDQIKTITGEQFKHIIYYPIFDIQDESKIIAMFEVAFKKKQGKEQILLDDEIQQYLDQFRSQLQQFRVRLNSFTRNLENIFIKRRQKAQVKMFQTWKQMMIFMQYKEQFQLNQFQALQNQEMCYVEYVQNIDNCNQQIKQVNEEKAIMQQQINQFQIEKKAKLKFLATSLMSTNNLFKRIRKQKMKEAFLKWQYNVSVRKIAETAFNRVLELNHRHSKARLRTGVFLLQNIVEGFTLQCAFDLMLQAAHLKRFEAMNSEVSPICKRSRSRSRSRGAYKGPGDSVAINNISSLLSPRNLKKIEKINLYKQHINSLYNPVGMDQSGLQNRVNSSDGMNSSYLSSHKVSRDEVPVKLKYSKTKSTFALSGLAKPQGISLENSKKQNGKRI